MKTIYMVRHGESVFNASTHFERGDTPLTERGRAQAEAVGMRLKTVPIDIIISSPVTRAKETADIIGQHIGQTPNVSELL